jgi:hypothetical protein
LTAAQLHVRIVVFLAIIILSFPLSTVEFRTSSFMGLEDVY